MTDASPDRDTAPDGASSRAGATSPPPETAGSSSSTQDLTLGLENLIVEASEARGDKKMETGAVVATTSGTDPLEMDDIDDEYFSQLMLANFSSSAIQRLKKYRKSARERPQTPPEERKRRQELWAWRRKQKAALFQGMHFPAFPFFVLLFPFHQSENIWTNSHGHV